MAEKLFKVLKIDEMIRVKDEGGIGKYYRHQIKTKGGTVLTIDIDEDDFTPEKAEPILAKRAADADKIKSL